MTVGSADGRSTTLSAPGSGYDEDGDGNITVPEPRYASRPHAVLALSGPVLQTVAFYLQLVRAIQAGVDVDGNVTNDLDAARIYYYGHSLGGVYGEMLFAYEPSIRAAVFVATPGTGPYNRTLAPLLRPATAHVLGQRIPSLLNSTSGVTHIDGQEVEPPPFNESLPLRNQPPVTQLAPGASAIQRVIDRMAWGEQSASPVAFAPLLRRTPPAGIRARPFIHQFARSDTSATTPASFDIARAGDFADRVVLYRHFGNEGVPADPHPFMQSANAPANYSRIALGAQRQIAQFFASDGTTIVHPTPTDLWEVPVRTPMPEDLFFLPRR